MRVLFSILLFYCVSITCNAQMYELGFVAGGSNFVGDIGASNYFKPNRPSFGLIYKYNINPRIALRANYTYFNIYGDDLESDNLFRNQRGFNFENNLNEFAVGIEYNFFEYEITSSGKKGTPYILVQAGLVDYETIREARLNGDPIYTRRSAVTIPFGLGYKSIIAGKLTFAIEARASYNFTDGIDYTTPRIDALNFGGNSNDWHMFTSFSLIYTFGRPSCYAYQR